MSRSDEELLSAAAQGDKDAMGALLARQGPLVRQTIATEIGSQYRSLIDEDDVMQVSYLEAFLRISDLRLKEVGPFVAWLRQIARNNLRDAIKGLTCEKRPDPRRQMRPTSPDESSAALFEIVGGGDLNTPSQIAGAAERKRILAAALQELPPDYARVITEYDLEGRSVEDVAASMGRSSGAVFMLRARALERLQERLPTISAMYGSRLA